MKVNCFNTRNAARCIGGKITESNPNLILGFTPVAISKSLKYKTFFFVNTPYLENGSGLTVFGEALRFVF